MPTEKEELKLQPAEEGSVAELRAWIATLKRMRPRDQAIQEAIEVAEEELRRKEAEDPPEPPRFSPEWERKADAVLATWSEEDERLLERAKHAIVPLIVEDEEP